MRSVVSIAGCLVLLGVANPSCGDEVRGGAILPELSVVEVGPSPLLPGTRLTIKGSGFVVAEVAELAVLFTGEVNGQPIDFGVRPVRIDDETLLIPVGGEVQNALIRDQGAFVGTVTVIRTPLIDADQEAVGIQVALGVGTALTPALSDFSPKAFFIGDEVTLSGDNFLHPSEGASLVQLSGTMTTEFPPRTIDIPSLQLPALPVSPERRDAVSFELTPDVLGIVPGTFSGQISVVNQTPGGIITQSAPLTIASAALNGPLIGEMEPLEASRGQWITFRGRGFTPPDGLLQVATLLVFEGVFDPDGAPPIELMGPSAVTLVPDTNEGNYELRAVLRVDIDTDGRPTGLGLVPGTFTGTVSPLLLSGPDSVTGSALAVTFRIAPQRQMIYLKLLPAFEEALAEFGLLADKDGVKKRILEVVERDYAGISIGFTFETPTDFAEYGIVEIAGRDPNGSGLFGLDNTSGKDVGNIRFDDIIGGYNADTNADGFSAYGGVFPAEFMNFSSTSANPLASSRFDDVFSVVAPALGGTPAELGESLGGDDRAQEIKEAVRVFGNLVGNTVSHEVGHSLGLSAVDGQFHNIGDNPGWLMDSGSNRSFAERAEMDGAGPGFFSPQSRAYLESILPLTQ